MPERISASAAASCCDTASGSPVGITPPSTSRAARAASGVSTRSWPPKTSSSRPGSPASANGAVAVTTPVVGASPAAIAAAPVMVVVATEPRLPISHAPVRRLCMRSSL